MKSLTNIMNKEELIKENKALKETCEILSDSQIMREIKKSFDDFKNGRFSKL